MILPQSKDAIHKAWLFRVLAAIYDEAELAAVLYFKGGTCAAMLDYLDRFSIDLDFDFAGEKKDLPKTRVLLKKVFHDLGLVIGDESKVTPQYFLKYEAEKGARNTLKIDISFPPPKANAYEPRAFREIDRVITCQTIETMMANKLVALTDRYERNEAIAGRDIYDIHHFFTQGYRYNEAVISERTGKETKRFLADLVSFIEKRITQKIIDQDLNFLLPYEKFSRIRGVLKREALMFLNDEIRRA